MDRLAETANEPAARLTQAERRDLSERDLMAAAIAVVAEEGIGAATFEAIGRRAGKSRGLVSQRFGSKQGFIEAVIAYLHEQQEMKMAEHGIDDMPGAEAVYAYVDVYLRELDMQAHGPAYFRLLSSAVAEASNLRTAFAEEHVRVERRLESLLLRGQAEGAIRPEIDADAAALMIGSQLLGLSMQMLVDPEMNMDPIRETTLATLRASFGVREAKAR